MLLYTYLCHYSNVKIVGDHLEAS